ncbi:MULTISPECIES: radical SAM protein [Bacteroidales]|jgi:uncharacterized protein|uniref:Radical SAM protein n=3 Tax=Bacteroidales TaxID=171549 RepID=A0AC61RIW1_9BACT|nr:MULTISPECIES: radical SAM protein [Bacteroidales]TGY77240.1 radical SAM protein [Lepagella muris]THG49147.1 radical SAM protein [Bacteroidales bacterium]TKC54211.1 radical SAM protein [Bacteroidales bacterium]
MKSSIYNYIITDDEYSYWYNGFSHQYFLLPLDLGNKIKEILKSPAAISQLPRKLYDKLQAGGFIVEDGVNELELVINENTKAINKKDYYMVILPTLNCNFKCWYCIQDHIPSLMTEEVISLVKRHIKYVIENLDLDTLHIEWFGGEPFLYFDKVIRPISEYAISICNEAKIPFFNSATTNGFYLTSKILPQLDKLKFRRFQITIDGNREFHDKVKFQKGCSSTFNHVLTNINNILTQNKDVEMILRINYTHTNLTYNIVNQVNSFITPANRQSVVISLKKVWQEAIDKSSYVNRVELLTLFEENGYKVSWFDAVTNFIPCYANKKYYCAVNYNGSTVKCTACNDLYEDKSKGYISGTGQIEWINDFDKKYCQPSFKNERCLKCKYLPVCMGICPRDFAQGHSYCKIENQDMEFEQSLINMIKHNVQNQ